MSPTPIRRRLLLGGALSTAIGSTALGENARPPAAAATNSRWLSGAGDPWPQNISGGGFGSWRRNPSTYARIWADASLADMRGVWMLDRYTAAGWDGTLDVACGGPRDGQTWRSAAAGGMDATWRATCRAVRRKWGNLAEVHLSMAHEMNGNWYPWSVTSATVTDFHRAWTRWHGIVQEELVAKGKRVRVCLSMNADNLSDVSVQDIAPAPELLDLVGCDFYSMWPDLRDEAGWSNHRHVTGDDGSPRGVEAWFDYARSLGKALSFPEWGVNPHARSDNPFFIRKMRATFAAHGCADPAKPGAGQVAGEAYFNHSDNCRLWPTSEIPDAAGQYRSLSWGN